MFHMSRITLDLPDELLEAVDSTRGLVPRNAWIRDVLTQHLNRPRVPEPKPSKPLPPVTEGAREQINWSPPSKGGYPSSDRLVTDLEQPPRPKPAPPKGHEFTGQKVAPNRCEVCGVVRGRHH